MTLVLTTNVVGQRRGEPVRLPNRRRRLSTIVARHRPSAGRPFIVSVHRCGDQAEIYQPNDRTVRLRATWSKTLVGPHDVVVITAAPLGKGALSIGLAIASIALIAIAPYAAPVIAGAALFGAGAGAAAGGLATAIQVGLVVGGVALGYAAQASKASGNKKAAESYSITGGGNVPKPGARKPLLYGRSWSAPPLSQQDFVNIDGDSTVLVKRMTLGLGKFRVHRVRVADAVFWDEASGIQAPFNAATGPLGAAIEVLYEQASKLAPGDIITSPSVGGQELPRPGGNPSRTPWFRLAPQGVSVDAAQMNWTYPAIYRLNKEGKEKGTSAGVVFFGREIDPNTGEVIGPEFELWRSEEPSPAFIKTPLRRVAYFRLPKSGAYEVCSQNAFPEAPASETQENRVIWDAMYAFEDDTRIRPKTTEIALRMRAGKGLTVTAYSDITVEATRIVPVWTGSAWVEQPTSKAVWAYCDLVRAEYGLDAPSGADADKALYYASLLSEYDTYDGQLPEVSSFWEAASEILHPLRADPVKVGAIHSFVRDESRAEPRHVLTRRQIVRDSAGVTYKAKVEGGDVIVEFDRDGDPKRPDEARYSYGTPSRTPKRYKIKGIRNGTHALKHATWLAAVAVFRGAERKITTEWDGRLVYPGDHILSDVWFLKDKEAYGVAARAGNVLTLDVTADVPADAWGYGSIRTRAGREWGILRMRGAGPRGLELHPDDVVALQAKTGLTLTDVLARDTQDPTTVVLGDLLELQETFVARSAIPTDADHVQIEMVKDDARVWQLLDEAVIAPAPVNADSLAEPLIPEIAVLHARCVRIETGIEVVWGVSTTRGARNFEVDLSYDGGRTWDPLSPFGPASSGRGAMRQVEGPVTVRARAYGPTGLPGAWKSTTFTTVAPVVDGSQTEIINLPPIDYAGLTEGVRSRLDHILEVEAYAQAVAVEAKRDFNAALARAEDVRTYAQGVSAQARADFQDAAGRADTALAKALQSLGNDTANAAAITSEAQARLTADGALTSRIDVAVSRIDGNTAAILQEASTRATAVETEARRTTALVAQTDADRAYFLNEQTARINQDGVFASDLTAVRTRLGTNEAAVLSEARARSDADSAQATRIDGLTATVGQNTAGLVEERQARADGDGAVTRYVQSLEATVGGNYGALLTEVQTRADADSALSSRIDTFGATVSGNTAAIVEERRVRADADSANASRSANLESFVFGETTPGSLPQTRASVLSEAQTRAAADSAAATRIDGLSTRVGGNEASIIEERQVRADADSANTRYIQSIETTVGSNYNLLLTEQTTRATQDQAITGYVSYVESVVGSNYSQLVDERNTRANADSALSQRIESTLATVANNYTLLTDETTARVNADNALAQRITDVQARTDAGTATGRFSLVAQSGPAGVSARIQALVAVQAGGQTRGAGFYVEAMDDGTSRFVVDASAFYITANGQSMPTFSFDGYTLTIPSLRVTQQAILPNSASDKRIAGNDNLNFDPAPFADGWREIPGTAIDFNVDSETWGLTWTATTALTVTATGTNATYKSVSLETAVAINGNIYNNYTTNAVATGAGGGVANGPTSKSTGGIGTTGMEIFGPGQQRISLYYRFKGDAGCTGRITYAVLKTLIQKR